MATTHSPTPSGIGIGELGGLQTVGLDLQDRQIGGGVSADEVRRKNAPITKSHVDRQR